MARGLNGFERPPWWATVVMVVGAVFLAGFGVFHATHKPADPVGAAEIARMAAAEKAAESADAARAPKPTLFLGDSYTAGTGASSQSHRWTTLVAQAQKWVENNRANGSTGYLAATTGAQAQAGCAQSSCPNYGQALAQVQGPAPDLVVVSGGRNDVPLVDAAYAGRVASFYRDLRTKYPSARIVAISPIWDDDPPPAQLPAISQAVRAGVQAVGGTYVDIGEPLTGHPDLVFDGVHPNDTGHKAVADAVDAALLAAGIRA